MIPPWLFLASVPVIVNQGYHMLPSITPNPGCFWRLFQLQFLRGVMLKLLERSRGYGLLDHHCITIGLWIMDYGLILTYLNTIIECDLPSGCRPHQQKFFFDPMKFNMTVKKPFSRVIGFKSDYCI